jgi:hypothetical protein
MIRERFTIIVARKSSARSRSFVYQTDRATAIEIARNVFAVCDPGEHVCVYLAGQSDPILMLGDILGD